MLQKVNWNAPTLQTTTRDNPFASTRWTVVHQAADSQTAFQHALSALTELCQEDRSHAKTSANARTASMTSHAIF